MNTIGCFTLAALLFLPTGCTSAPAGTVLGIESIFRPEMQGNAIRMGVALSSRHTDSPGPRQRSIAYRIDGDRIVLYVVSLPGPIGPPYVSTFDDPMWNATISPVEKRRYTIIDGTDGRELGTVEPITN